MAKQRKPKFKVGQVVFDKGSMTYAKVSDMDNRTVELEGLFEDDNYQTDAIRFALIKDIRPLTKKERGE